MAEHDDGGTDWRRLASDRNVSHGVARALWEQARAASPDDPAQAEHAFHAMLDEAEAANITHEPGRETLTDAALGGRDPSSLGPGKLTRVLLEQPKPAAGPREATAAKPSAEQLRSQLAAAGQAGKTAAAALAASDRATIVEALRELRSRPGSGVLQKIVNAAGGAIERVLDHQQAQPTKPGPAATDPTASQPAKPAPARAPAAPPPARGPDRKG